MATMTISLKSCRFQQRKSFINAGYNVKNNKCLRDGAWYENTELMRLKAVSIAKLVFQNNMKSGILQI